MLNPFIIEKSLFDYIRSLQNSAQNFRVTLSKQTLEKYQDSLDSTTKDRMKQFVEKANKIPKKYLCRYCSKPFDDGRKLGGHVSRAHKELLHGIKKEQKNKRRGQVNKRNDIESDLEEEIDEIQQQQSIEIYRRTFRKSNKNGKILTYVESRPRSSAKTAAIYNQSEDS